MHYCSDMDKILPKTEKVASCASYLAGFGKNILKIHKLGIDSILRLLFFFCMQSFFFVCFVGFF